jgi:hypothetical protein
MTDKGKKEQQMNQETIKEINYTIEFRDSRFSERDRGRTAAVRIEIRSTSLAKQKPALLENNILCISAGTLLLKDWGSKLFGLETCQIIFTRCTKWIMKL